MVAGCRVGVRERQTSPRAAPPFPSPALAAAQGLDETVQGTREMAMWKSKNVVAVQDERPEVYVRHDDQLAAWQDLEWLVSRLRLQS